MIVGLLLMSGLMVGCTKNTATLPTQETNVASSTVISESTENGATAATQGKTTTENKNLTNKVKITVADALKAYEQVYPNTAVTSLDLDTSFGAYYYEIQGMDDSKEYEVKVNALTGETKKEREETLDSDEQNGVEKKNSALNVEKLVSIEEITEIAEQAANQGEAFEWSLEREMDTTYWEVNVQAGNTEISVKINAQTGAVLETEQDD